MFNWLMKKLGIVSLQDRVTRTENAINRIEKKTRIGKMSQRYDEIERARKLRKKGRV